MQKEVIGGKLKLKKPATIKKAIHKMKPEESPKVAGLIPKISAERKPEVKEAGDVEKSPQMLPKEGHIVRKTAAELRYEKTIKERLATRIEQKLKKTHREKIDEYNKQLAKLPEHFDIPRVGPG